MYELTDFSDFNDLLNFLMGDPEFAAAYAALQDEREGIQHDMDDLARCD